MPYVVTTSETTAIARGVGHAARFTRPVSRQAVATLEEAAAWARVVLTEHHATKYEPNWPESGGTVGPLPDGTVIEVERLLPLMLSVRAGVSGAAVMECLHADDWSPLIAAFNAREATP